MAVRIIAVQGARTVRFSLFHYPTSGTSGEASPEPGAAPDALPYLRAEPGVRRPVLLPGWGHLDRVPGASAALQSHGRGYSWDGGGRVRKPILLWRGPNRARSAATSSG